MINTQNTSLSILLLSVHLKLFLSFVFLWWKYYVMLCWDSVQGHQMVTSNWLWWVYYTTNISKHYRSGLSLSLQCQLLNIYSTELLNPVFQKWHQGSKKYVMHVAEKRLISSIYKIPYKSLRKWHPNRKIGRGFEHYKKENLSDQITYEMCSPSLVIREM